MGCTARASGPPRLPPPEELVLTPLTVLLAGCEASSPTDRGSPVDEPTTPPVEVTGVDADGDGWGCCGTFADLTWSRTESDWPSFGSALHAGGDPSGDGVNDLLVCGPVSATHLDGGVLLYPGGIEMPALPVAIGNATTPLGAMVDCDHITTGDLDGDGADDVVAGASATWTVINDGVAYVFVDGFSTGAEPTTVLVGTERSLMATVAVPGDATGDGYEDLLVGAPGWNADLVVSSGSAFLFPGGPGGPATVAAWTVTSDVAGSSVGADLGGGDLDGDGLADLLVVASWATLSEPREGTVAVYFGADPGPAAVPDWVCGSGQAHAGIISAETADIDADGYLDVIWASVAYEPASHVALVPGGPQGPEAGVAWSAEGGVGPHGVQLMSTGDVDADGFVDIVVGPELGLWFGAPGLPGSAPDWRWGQLVTDLAVGDLDGDGDDDIVASDASVETVWLLGGGPRLDCDDEDPTVHAGDGC